MRFESKRDLWLVLLMRLVPVIVLVPLGSIWYGQRGDWRGPLAGAVIVLFAELFLFEWILRSTYYEIEGDTLFVRSSFITWRVPIREIRSVTPTRSPMSSPALSLDRLRIEYGQKSILVSPADRERFIAMLRSVNPAITV